MKINVFEDENEENSQEITRTIYFLINVHSPILRITYQDI